MPRRLLLPAGGCSCRCAAPDAALLPDGTGQAFPATAGAAAADGTAAAAREAALSSAALAERACVGGASAARFLLPEPAAAFPGLFALYALNCAASCGHEQEIQARQGKAGELPHRQTNQIFQASAGRRVGSPAPAGCTAGRTHLRVTPPDSGLDCAWCRGHHHHHIPSSRLQSSSKHSIMRRHKFTGGANAPGQSAARLARATQQCWRYACAVLPRVRCAGTWLPCDVRGTAPGCECGWLCCAPPWHYRAPAANVSVEVTGRAEQGPAAGGDTQATGRRAGCCSTQMHPVGRCRGKPPTSQLQRWALPARSWTAIGAGSWSTWNSSRRMATAAEWGQGRRRARLR